MKKSISINLQGLLFHVEEDGYEQLRQYLSEVKAHFSNYAGAADIVADIEGRIAELFAARLGADKQVISAEDVAAVTAQLGRVADFDLPEDEDDQPAMAGAATGYGDRRTGTDSRQTADYGATGEEPAGPRRLFRDEANKKFAGVAAGLAYYFNTNPLWIRLGFVLTALLNTDWLGNMDHRLHVNFGGLSVLTYLVLWMVMPKANNLPPVSPDTQGPGAGRKLYRDTEYGSVGGVAAGLAHYFKLDVTLVRVLFVVLTLAGASGILIYLVLWIVVPEATTLSEKLEMRGEDVTLASIDQSLRSDAPPGAGRARVVQDNLRSVGSTVAPVFKFLFMLVAGFAGFILMVVALAMIVAFGAVLGVVLGVFPANGMHTGDIPVELLRATLPTWGLVAGFVAFLIPAISLLLLALRLFIRRPFVPATVRLTLLGVWLLSIITLAGSIAGIRREFRERGEVQRAQDFTLAAPVVLLDTQYDDTDLRIRDLNVATTDSGQPARLVLRLTARGANAGAAREAAENIVYAATLRDDSVLVIPHEFSLKSGSPWREHEVRATLQLPPDRRYRLSESFTNLLDDDAYDTRYSRDNLNNKRLFVVEKGHFKLVSGPETKLPKDDEYDQHDDERGDDVHVRIGDLDLSENFRGDFKLAEPRAGAPSRTFRETDFERVDLSGAYHARIRQGSTFRVVARGNEDDLNDVRVRTNGTTLEIEPRHSVRWFQWRTHHPVVFDIELPTLAGLEVSGAAHADVSGFRGADIDIDQSGASWLRMAVDGSQVKLDVSGASHTLLTGSTPKLTAELSGACELRGRSLKAVDASIDASGACRASVHVSHDLSADASGASHITYYGHPTDATTNSNGAGSVRSGDGNNGDEDSDDDDEDGVTLALPAAPALPAVPAAPAAPAAPGW